MKKVFSFCVVVILAVMSLTCAAATINFTPYQLCPQCGKGIIGVSCGGPQRLVCSTHDEQVVPSHLEDCHVREYYTTLYMCTRRGCSFRQYGPHHLEWTHHPDGRVQICCPF